MLLFCGHYIDSFTLLREKLVESRRVTRRIAKVTIQYLDGGEFGNQKRVHYEEREKLEKAVKTWLDSTQELPNPLAGVRLGH